MPERFDADRAAESGSSAHRAGVTGQVVVAALWVGGAAVIALLLVQRYRGAIGTAPLEHGNNVDFGSFFRAGRDVSHGKSPYDGSDLYTYFAPLALVMSLAAHADPITVLRFWTVLGLASLMGAVIILVWALRDRLGAAWQVPVVFTVCAGIGLHLWPMVYELFLGNDDIVVLLLVVVSAAAWRSERPVWFGVVVGSMCLIKIWPALLMVAVLQAGVDVRRRVVAAAAFGGMIAAGLASNLIPAGTREFTGFGTAIRSAESLRLVSDSISGIPNVLFSESGLARPVVVSGSLRYLLTAFLGAWVIGLLVFGLRNRREPLLCIFNVTVCAVLIVPVSHMCYTILALPVVWYWLGNFRVFLDRSRRGWHLVVQLSLALSLVLWVLVQSRAWPGDGSPANMSSVRFAVVFVANLALYSTSVFGGRVLLGDVRARTTGSQLLPPDDIPESDMAAATV